MWLYSICGFFSVVQKPGETDLTIRSRVRADLERLGKLYIPSMSAIVENDGSDYRFRAKATHAAFADAAYHIAQDIDYSNFKDAVAEEQGIERANIYAKVWSASLGLTKLSDQLSETDQQRISEISSLHVSDKVMLRALYHIHEYNSMRHWRSMPFYAVAEKLGLAVRENDAIQSTPEQHAKALASDGRAKEWIFEAPTPKEWRALMTAFVYHFLQDDATFKAGEPWMDKR